MASSNRKVYMLFELEPSREITGGAWYTGHEYDSEFIEVLRQQCHQYIKREKRATLGTTAGSGADIVLLCLTDAIRRLQTCCASSCAPRS